jgi:hypothetical protein
MLAPRAYSYRNTSLVANICSGLHFEDAEFRRYAKKKRGFVPFSRPSGEKGYVHS